jgi:two-component sensor histidine kinase
VLTASSWNGASLDEVAGAAVNFLQDNARTRIQMDGPNIWLRPQAAFMLSLVLNELATNALKYGALSNETGRVELVWRVAQADGLAPRLALHWREANGPPVAPPTRRGFGSRLIQEQLAVELDGQVNCDYALNGLVCSIELPFISVVE